MRRIIPFICLLMIVLAGCSDFPLLGNAPISSPVLSDLETAPIINSPSPISTATPEAVPSGPTRLIVWIPPFMSLESESPSADLLKLRLEEFENQYQDLVIETRVKAVYGPGGLLDSLGAASAAAPTALPDLVALPRDIEETAAVKGLLLPLDDLTDAPGEPDWYPYAQQLAHLQKNIYGFPFAGDALVQVFHSNLIAEPLTSWQMWIDLQQSLIFPAGSDEAFITLALYQANGGMFRDDQGRPQLSTKELSDVLDFYQNSLQVGSINGESLIQLQDDQAAWDAFKTGKGQSLITWASRYLQERSELDTIVHIPTPEGEPFALANGWVWAVAGRDEQKRQLAVSLAEFLTDSQFLSDWSLSAGYLPTRPSSINLWTDAKLAKSTIEIVSAAVLIPQTDVLSVVQVPLQQAAITILKGQSDPLEAAKQASDSIITP